MDGVGREARVAIVGLGGHLLWTAALRALSDTSRRPVRVCHAPKLSDLLSARLYDASVSLAEDEVFAGNPRADFPPTHAKSAVATVVDRLGDALVRRLGLSASYERLVFGLARRRHARTGQFDVHLDLALHSYVDQERPDRLVWKSGGHIVDILLKAFDVPSVGHQGELYLTEADVTQARAFIDRARLRAEFIVIEPNSKDTWFGDLRAWPFDRWQEVVNALVSRNAMPVVQVGERGGRLLQGVVDARGALPLRAVFALMKQARVFLGQEGGLMHAARALGTRSVIVWGGLTLPEFAAYPEAHTVLCTRVECAPCGLRGGCPFAKKCLTSIPVDAVTRALAAECPEALHPQGAA